MELKQSEHGEVFQMGNFHQHTNHSGQAEGAAPLPGTHCMVLLHQVSSPLWPRTGNHGKKVRFPRKGEAKAASGTSPEDVQRCLLQDQTGDEQQGNEGQNKGPESTVKFQIPECEPLTKLSFGLSALSSPPCKTDPTIPSSIPPCSCSSHFLQTNH